MSSTPGRSPGCCRGYTSEQKSLRAKLDYIIKWGRDLKSNIMKQSCKALQTTNTNTREIIDQIHDDLDDYKRKLDRELGLIHDICDALTINNQVTNGDEENLHDEILAALRRSPTYTSLEQHIYDDKRPRIRVKPRERIHPGQNQIPRAPFLSMNSIKRKASQPIKLNVIDTTSIPGAKRRPPVDAFKRSRSFTNVEHIETQLGMDYIEEDEDDLAWKPFGPKKSLSEISFTPINDEDCNDEQLPRESSITTSQSLPSTPIEKPRWIPPPSNNDDSSDEEFDVAWERREKQKARKEAAAAPPPPPPPVESPTKRSVRFLPSVHDPIEVIELDLDETTEDGFELTADQNTTPTNNNNRQSNGSNNDVVNMGNDDETTMSASQQTEINTQQTTSESQITMTSTAPSSSSQPQRNNDDDNSQIIDDSDDEIIALSDEDVPSRPNNTSKKVVWTSSDIQITGGNSQSQSMHNPYRIGIADPSIRSIFLPPPNSQSMSNSSGGSKRSQPTNRKRTTGAK
ncbi:unnamed protein product [Adineta steineri]|uniref:Uncharacterized protein n=1 Tax=Adineta steineri TaxID=433720 RepID=A0A815S1M3_9BILA|nr:unnamed protein product [Adineta steineri]CAF1486103.1 unnamed protein product [Adineta steineri]CAF4073159.1 unnamed protein product [Adineta steineri]